MSNESQSIGGIPITSESIGYAADEMIACGRCTKRNPPNRLNCLYCGEVLEIPGQVASGIRFRPTVIESWELGTNIVAVDGLRTADKEAIVSTLPFDTDIAERLGSVRPPLPMFRVPNSEGSEVESRLSRAGLSTVRVDDADLGLSKLPTRLRHLEFRSDSLLLFPFNSDDTIPISKGDILLVVVGFIVQMTAESKLKKTRKETKHIDEHVSSSDHDVIDIYAESHGPGFRIVPHGFDFSCLGERKSLISSENVKTLIAQLGRELPDAVIDRSYVGKTAVLDHVWPRTVSNTSKGFERSWLGIQRSTGSTTSNEEQFLRYSRICRKLYEGKTTTRP